MTGYYIEKALSMIHDAKKGVVKPFLELKDIKSFKSFRLSSRIGFGVGKYMIFFGTSGAGKTAFIDSNFVVTPLIESFYVDPAKRTNTHYIYRAMERPPEEKIVRFISFLLYWKYDIIIDKATLLQWPSKKRSLTDDDMIKIKSLDPYLEFISSRVTILGGARTAKDLHEYNLSQIYKRGAFFKSDLDSLTCNGKRICDFDGKIADGVNIGNKKITPSIDIDGNKILTIESNDKKVTINQQGQAFIPNNDNDMLVIINDTINKVLPEPRQSTLEMLISHSTNMGILRDANAAAIIDVAQMAKDDLKDIGKNLHLTQGHIKGAGDIPNNADIILSLINPLQYDITEYNPRPGVEFDFNRCHGSFRVGQVIKNSDGNDEPIKIPLSMLGEVGYFKELNQGGMNNEDYAELDKLFAHRYNKVYNTQEELF